MPPMPPMPHRPPMSGMPPPPPAEPSLAGLSATMASVVISRPATEAASSSAVRTTFAGSITPNLNRSPYSSVCALKPNFGSLDSRRQAQSARLLNFGNSNKRKGH